MTINYRGFLFIPGHSDISPTGKSLHLVSKTTVDMTTFYDPSWSSFKALCGEQVERQQDRPEESFGLPTCAECLAARDRLIVDDTKEDGGEEYEEFPQEYVDRDFIASWTGTPYNSQSKPTSNEREVRTTSSTGGQKGVKPQRYSLIPVPALDIMAKLYGFGAEKYAAHNWRKGYEWSKSFDSLFRHATAALNGEDIDPETGLPHLAGAAFHCFTLMVFMQEHPEFDDRYKKSETE